MDYTTDVPVHEYAGLVGEAADKSVSKPCRKYALVYRVIVALGVCIGMISFFGWEQQQADVVDLQTQATYVANEMKMMMASPQEVAEAKDLALALSSFVDPDLEAKAMHVAKPVEELMADPDFVKNANYVAVQFKALMDAPVVQKETKLLNEQMKTVIASLHAQESELQGRRLSSAAATGKLSRPLMGSRPKAFALRQPAMDKRDFSIAAITRKAEANTVPLFEKLGDAKLLTTLGNAKLLTAAERAGTFSALEKAGAFSTAEKLLPIVDDLGLLPFLQDAVDSGGASAFAQGAGLVALGPIYSALVNQGFLPELEGGAAAAPAVVFTGTTGAGLLLIVLANIVGQLKNAKSA